MVHLSSHSWIAIWYHLARSYDVYLRFQDHELLHEASSSTVPDFSVLSDNWIYYEHLTLRKRQQRKSYGNLDYFTYFRCPLL